MKKILFLLFSGFIFSQACFGMTMEFLSIPVGARPIAMGGAVSAFPGDINTVIYNPAGLSSVRSGQVEFSIADWIDTLQYESATYCDDLLKGHFGINLFNLHAKSFDETDLSGFTGKMIEYRNFCLTTAYGINIGNLGLGANMRMASSPLSDGPGVSFTGTLGGLFSLWIASLHELRFAFVLNNIGLGTKSKENIPTNLTLGLCSKILNLSSQKIQLTVDYQQPFDKTMNFTVTPGIEYILFNVLSLRAGYKFNTDLNHITLGAGIDCFNMSFNYALSSFNDLGDTHTASVSIRISQMVSESKKKNLETKMEKSYRKGLFEETIRLCREIQALEPDNEKAKNCLKTVNDEIKSSYEVTCQNYEWDKALLLVDLLLKINPKNLNFSEKKDKIRSILNDRTPPEIFIKNVSASNIVEIDSSSSNISGTITDDIHLKEVFINGQKQVLPDKHMFVIDLKWENPEDNRLTISAEDMKGNSVIKTVNIQMKGKTD